MHKKIATFVGTTFLLPLIIFNTSLPATKKHIEKNYKASIHIRCPTKKGAFHGSGSTIIKGDHTYIITAAHVIEHLRKKQNTFEIAEIVRYGIHKKTHDKRIRLLTFARVVKYDPVIDFAILKIDYPAASYQSIRIEKDDAKIGREVYAITTPGNERNYNLLTFGYVVNLECENSIVRSPFCLDTCDYNINPGSSGGPIFDKNTGHFIGIVLHYDRKYASHPFLPLRHIRSWAEKTEYGFLFDEKAEHPKAELLEGVEIETEMSKLYHFQKDKEEEERKKRKDVLEKFYDSLKKSKLKEQPPKKDSNTKALEEILKRKFH